MSGNDEKDERGRFSDDMLFQMSHKLDAHIEHCDEQFERGITQFKELANCIESNNNSQTTLIESITKLTDATAGVVQLEKDVKSVVKVGKGAQNFLLWVIKWPLIATGLVATYQWVIVHAPFK